MRSSKPPAEPTAAAWVPIDRVHPWSKNPRINDGRPVDEVKASIKRFGWGAPIVARLEDGRIIAGHTRYKAAKALGLETVPVRFVDVDEAQADLMALADNRTNELASWNLDGLGAMLGDILGAGLDLDGLGWNADEIAALLEPEPEPYTRDVKVPIYEPTGEQPPVSSLVDRTKALELERRIVEADVPDDVRAFLLLAAARHHVFDYRSIAEFYAHAEPEVQDLMEQSALVIIDYGKAIENGFVALTEELRVAASKNENGFVALTEELRVAASKNLEQLDGP